VLDAGRRRRLAYEAFDQLGPLAELRAQHLDREVATRQRVLGLIHHAESSAADPLLNAVAFAEQRSFEATRMCGRD